MLPARTEQAATNASGSTRSAPAQFASTEAVPDSPALLPPYPDPGDPAALGRWFGQTTHLPPASVLAVTDNAIFAAFPKHSAGAFWTVDVRVESITPAATAKLGGRSLHLRLNVRCDSGMVRLSFLDVYPGVDLTGTPLHRAPPNGWATPKPNSYVADALRLACDKTFRGPFAAIAAAATPAPSPSPVAHPPLAHSPVAAAPSPARSPSTSDIHARTPQVGVYAVQIGAYSTAEASRGAWESLKRDKPEIADGLSHTAKPVDVGGRTLYRAVVQGFPSSAAASSFCQTLRSGGHPCLVLGAAKP